MRRIIKLSKELYDYLINMLSGDKDLRESVKNNSNTEDDNVTITLDVNTKIDLMEYVEDLQLEIGFVNEDSLNDDGRKLQQIYDDIYYQTNS